MYQFNYHKPTSLNDAVALFQEADDPMYLSGGMTLIPTMKQRLAAPTDVIDLSAIAELTGVQVAADKVSVGGFTRHNDVARSGEIAATLPVLCSLAGEIGDNQVRNRGTMGGSVANSDPAADYPAAVVGLGATIATQSREIAGDDFFKDLFETDLNPERSSLALISQCRSVLRIRSSRTRRLAMPLWVYLLRNLLMACASA